MARSRKFTETTITEALDTPVEQTIEGAALNLGVDPFRLQEIFVERLGIEEPMTWLTIPLEHEPLLADIHRGIDSEASVRRLEIPPVVQEEAPNIQDAAPIEQTPHTDPSGLTQTKTEAIDQNRQAATQTNQGISEALMLLQAQ